MERSVVAGGGWFMVIMNVIRLITLSVTTIILGINVYKIFKKDA